MKKIIIDKNSSEIRLDKFLSSYFAKATKDNGEFFLYSRGEIIRNIRSGNILVNNRKVKPSYILDQGDVIKSKVKNQKSKLTPNQKLNIKIIHQDENIIAVDKPAGIAVHPVKPEEKDTLVNFLIYKFPEIKNIHDDSKDAWLRPGIVHRLDKETSGIMVVARNMKTFQELKNLFKQHKIEKKYLAIVYGKLEKKLGIISKPIARAGTYKKQVIAGRKTKTKIREAVTKYKVLKEFKDCSLLEVTPKTGRMHQIRVHLFSIGHPVAGDKIYKAKPWNKKRLSLEMLEIKRQMLHAREISFNLFEKSHSFSSPLPDDFSELLQALTKGQ